MACLLPHLSSDQENLPTAILSGVSKLMRDKSKRIQLSCMQLLQNGMQSGEEYTPKL